MLQLCFSAPLRETMPGTLFCACLLHLRFSAPLRDKFSMNFLTQRRSGTESLRAAFLSYSLAHRAYSRGVPERWGR